MVNAVYLSLESAGAQGNCQPMKGDGFVYGASCGGLDLICLQI